jgi:hypothetical protein
MADVWPCAGNVVACAGKASYRKLRLLACACTSQLLPLAKLLPDITRSALAEVVEYADGGTTKAAMKRVRERIATARAAAPRVDEFVCYAIEYASTEKQYLRTISYTASVLRSWGSDLAVPSQASIFRHIIGNPFRPYPAPPSWPSTVMQLAESLYAGQDCAFALHDAPLERATPNWPSTSGRRNRTRKAAGLLIWCWGSRESLAPQSL